MGEKQVLHYTARKGITAAEGCEHQRRWSERGWQEHTKGPERKYNRSRVHLNFEIKRGGVISEVDKTKTLPERMAENLAARGIVDPNANLEKPRFRTVVEFILSGNHDRMCEIAFGEQKVDPKDKTVDHSAIERMKAIEEWALDEYNFVAEKYGEENIIGFYVHLDETTPHIHCTVMPIRDGKFAFKAIFAGDNKYEFGEKTRQLHTDHWEKVGRKWGLERGDSVAESKAKHQDPVEHLKEATRWCFTLEEEIQEYSKILRDLKKQYAIANRRVKGLSTMIDNKKTSLLGLQGIIEELEKGVTEKQLDKETADATLADLRNELSETEVALEERKEKLQEAEVKLSEVEQELANLTERGEELMEDYREEVSDSLRWKKAFVASLMLETSVNELQGMMGKMQPEDRGLFEGSLIESLAERGNEVFTCATMLFMGMVEQALHFANESGGGGGGGSNNLPRKKKDEDDRAFGHRCVATAVQMMKPAKKKKKR